MLSNESVTLYHYDPEEEAYHRTYYSQASHYGAVQAIPKDKGQADGSVHRLRIPTRADLNIGLEDYACLGQASEEQPDKGVCWRVTGFCDNRRGALPHWRIDCE